METILSIEKYQIAAMFDPTKTLQNLFEDKTGTDFESLEKETESVQEDLLNCLLEEITDKEQIIVPSEDSNYTLLMNHIDTGIFFLETLIDRRMITTNYFEQREKYNEFVNSNKYIELMEKRTPFGALGSDPNYRIISKPEDKLRYFMQVVEKRELTKYLRN
jgi:hypothetical protein